jgi:CDP-2,3-bis-(O-geranylgeranyl)-sn-glycerol synthase
MFVTHDQFQAFLLLVAANAAPVIVAKLARQQEAAPLDFGYILRDGERLFGAHKTWRGLLFGTAACALVGGLMGVPAWIGIGFGAVSLLADALSSAVKRRLHLRPGSEALGLDQFGEAFMPLFVFARALEIRLSEVLFVTLAFFVLDAMMAPLRSRPWIKSSRRAEVI